MVGFEMANSRETLHPGRILLSQAMEPLGISRNQLARDINVPVGRISDITNGKRGVTADTALRLGRYFGTGPELWLRLQAEFDLYVARRTTWPAVENRVRVLTSEALVKAPVAALVDAMPSVDESAIEKEVFAGLIRNHQLMNLVMNPVLNPIAALILIQAPLNYSNGQKLIVNRRVRSKNPTTMKHRRGRRRTPQLGRPQVMLTAIPVLIRPPIPIGKRS